jgi:hypothetical protein
MKYADISLARIALLKTHNAGDLCNYYESGPEDFIEQYENGYIVYTQYADRVEAVYREYMLEE